MGASSRQSVARARRSGRGLKSCRTTSHADSGSRSGDSARYGNTAQAASRDLEGVQHFGRPGPCGPSQLLENDSYLSQRAVAAFAYSQGVFVAMRWALFPRWRSIRHWVRAILVVRWCYRSGFGNFLRGLPTPLLLGWSLSDFLESSAMARSANSRGGESRPLNRQPPLQSPWEACRDRASSLSVMSRS